MMGARLEVLQKQRGRVEVDHWFLCFHVRIEDSGYL